jgi:Fur family peroxide stress response transcriptional regulator
MGRGQAERVRQHCEQRLREHGLRVTRPRLAVYQALCASHDHPTAEELYRRLGEQPRRISMATIYNCLEALTRSGLAARLDAGPGAARFEAETKRHHHLICRQCGRVEDIFDPRLDTLDVVAPEGFEVESHTVHFHGLCEDCRNAPEPALADASN